MIRYKKMKTLHLFQNILMFFFIFLVMSCKGAEIPATQPVTLTNQVTDFPTSLPKISAGQHLRFDRISLEQGLSQSTIFCMLQDSQGFMWFGTEDGLNKYDGYTFTIYKHDPENVNSLSDNWIQAIFEDSSGMLWIGTREGGLVGYDRNLDQFMRYRNNPENPSSLSDDEITAIYQDQDGALWIGTGGGGLDRFDQENQGFVHYQNDPEDPHSLSSNSVTTIYEDQKGTLWVGTEDGGLNKFESELGQWQKYLNDPGDSYSLIHNNISAILEDQSGDLWVGTGGGGLDRFDQDNEQFIHYQHDPDKPESLSSDEIEVIFQDQEGILWIGTYGGGLNRFAPDNETFTHYQNAPGDPQSLSSDIVLSISQDREGVLWFGAIGGGLNKLDVGSWNFALFQNDSNDPNSLGDDMVRVFHQDTDGNLWVGTMFGGIDLFDRENNIWRHFYHDPNNPDSLSNNFVSAIYKDSSGAIWIGTASGLDRFDSETETFTHYQADPDAPPGTPTNNVRTIYESDMGEFWIGTKGGLFRFNQEKNSWSDHYYHDPDNPDSLGDDWVFSFLEDRQGRLWVGTLGGGLNLFDPENGTFIVYQNDPDDPQSLSNNFVTSIFQDRGGRLWIGTPGGLDKFEQETDTFIHYRKKDGMLNNNIYCIVEDEQEHLWFSTNQGLSMFDPQRGIFRNYTVTDGLQSNEFNGGACLVGVNGEMFFGGIDGFNTFFPEQIINNPTIPPIVLTSLAHDGEEVNFEIAIDRVTEVTFKWPDNSFEFEFAALSYAHSDRNQYAYYLEGFDEDWNEIRTRRYGKYTNLPGGTYTLRLRGSNNDGIWNEVGYSIQITIIPPFWNTWWFQVVVFIALAGVIYGGYQRRIRNLEGHSRELESQVEQRTTELMETQEALRQSELEKAITEERSRLARELHDSVTQSLHSSTMLAEAGQRLAGSGDIERARGYLIRLGEISQQALKEMRMLVYELRPLALREVGLAGALQQRLDIVERRSGVEVQLSVEDEFDLPPSIEEELFRVAMEALNNALKHANATTVTVILRKGERHNTPCVELEIADDGSGFDFEEMGDEGGLGLGKSVV